MNALSERLLQDVWERLIEIYIREKKRIDEIKDWSVLHDGIMSYIKITRLPLKYGKAPVDLAIDVHEPFSWGDDAYKFELGSYIEELTDEMLKQEFWPALQEKVRTLQQSGEMGSRFFRYRFQLELDFQRPQGQASLQLSTFWLDEEKHSSLKNTLNHFIETKVLSDPPVRPKPNDGFFFSRLLVNPDFLPEGRRAPDPLHLERLSAALESKFSAQPERLNAWKHEYARALIGWAQEHFLPLYGQLEGRRFSSFELLHEDQRPPLDEQLLEFFLYAAIEIGAYDAEQRLEYLSYARELGSEKAKQYLQSGSGAFESSRRGTQFQGRANDVLQQIDLKIKEENEQAYREALDYLCDLLRQGFPREYALKLKSTEKHLLPLKKLAKSPLHRFFANALHYPALFPLIAEYAELAMQEFAWYNDVTPGEKSVMPGTYAVLGLGLVSAKYDHLLIRYMQLVDTEHQSAHDDYPTVFLEARPLDAQTMPVLAAILLGGGQSARPLREPLITTPELARLLKLQIEPMEDYQRELVLYRLFGGEEKLLRQAKKAAPEMREALMEL
ncbi:hypothetical protein B9G55_04110 [Saccharibacillus sp. O16]|nr:hypothetical protein B9G55_04110 [Saccharibacillus sp. O16]